MFLISRLHDHSVRHTTRCRDLYLITHNTHRRQTSTLPRDSDPHSQQAIGRSPTPLAALPMGSASNVLLKVFSQIGIRCERVNTCYFRILACIITDLIYIRTNKARYAAG